MPSYLSKPARVALGTLLLLAATLAMPLARADGMVVTTATPALIEGQLTQAGLKFSKLNEQTYAVELGAGDIKFAIINKGTFLAAHFGIKAPGTGLDKINKWNATKYFSRAYLDDEGDPALESEFDVEKGVTAAAVGQFVQRFRASIAEFVQAL